MRNNRRQEAMAFIRNANAAATTAREAAAAARSLLGFDMRDPSSEWQARLEIYATRAQTAADAAEDAGTAINPDRFENTALWEDVLDAHRAAMEAATHAHKTSAAVRAWLQ